MILDAIKTTLGQSEPFNASRVHLEEFVKRAAATLKKTDRMLDAGAGNGLYRHLFDHTQYESADFCQVQKGYDKKIDYVCDLRAIPVEEGRYDLVLFTQVLNHVTDPLAVARELRRVLKPGGTVWLTCGFSYQECEQPYDFYRYTQFGLRHVLTEAGFEIVELKQLEGYTGTASYQIASAANWLPRAPRHYGGGMLGVVTASFVLLSRPFFRFLAFLLAKADQRKPYLEAGYGRNYCAIARK